MSAQGDPETGYSKMLPDPEYDQGGPRSLWDEIEVAYHRWTHHGQPGHPRLGLTITPSGNPHLWVDDPTSIITSRPADPATDDPTRG
jgi:hypothetical protein